MKPNILKFTCHKTKDVWYDWQDNWTFLFCTFRGADTHPLALKKHQKTTALSNDGTSVEIECLPNKDQKPEMKLASEEERNRCVKCGEEHKDIA